MSNFNNKNYNGLVSYVKKNIIMYKSQYGFREAHFTGLALMELIKDITSNLDTINHSIFIKKLCQQYGVRGVASSWIKYYLTNRKQFVVYDDICSDYRTM